MRIIFKLFSSSLIENYPSESQLIQNFSSSTSKLIKNSSSISRLAQNYSLIFRLIINYLNNYSLSTYPLTILTHNYSSSLAKLTKNSSSTPQSIQNYSTSKSIKNSSSTPKLISNSYSSSSRLIKNSSSTPKLIQNSSSSPKLTKNSSSTSRLYKNSSSNYSPTSTYPLTNLPKNYSSTPNLIQNSSSSQLIKNSSSSSIPIKNYFSISILAKNSSSTSILIKYYSSSPKLAKNSSSSSSRLYKNSSSNYSSTSTSPLTNLTKNYSSTPNLTKNSSSSQLIQNSSSSPKLLQNSSSSSRLAKNSSSNYSPTSTSPLTNLISNYSTSTLTKSPPPTMDAPNSKHILLTPSTLPLVIAKTADILKGGGVIALPTDTLYGLAGLASCEKVIRKIYEIKGRVRDKPLALCCGSVDEIGKYVEVSVSEKMMRELLPGPVTLIFRRRDKYKYLNPGTELLGVRVPCHEFTQCLLSTLPAPLVLTSANLTGATSTLAPSEFTPLFPFLDLIIDEGMIVPYGQPDNRAGSTVVDLSLRGTFYIVREGIECGRVRGVLEKELVERVQ